MLIVSYFEDLLQYIFEIISMAKLSISIESLNRGQCYYISLISVHCSLCMLSDHMFNLWISVKYDTHNTFIPSKFLG